MQYPTKISVIRSILFGYSTAILNFMFFIRIMALWLFTLLLGISVVVGSVFSTLFITQYFGGERIRIRDLRALWRLFSACADTGPKCIAEAKSFLGMIWTRHHLLIVAAIVALVLVLYMVIVFVLAYRRAALDIKDHGYSTVRRFISCFYLMPKIIVGAALYTVMVSIVLFPIAGIRWFQHGSLFDINILYNWEPWLQYFAVALSIPALFLMLRFQFFLYRIVDIETLPTYALMDSFMLTHGSTMRLLLLRTFFSAVSGGLIYAYWYIDTVAGTWLLLYPLLLLPAQRLTYAYVYRSLLAHHELPERTMLKKPI